MENALRGLSWSRAERYDDCSASDPRARLEPGSLDDEGARRLGHAQSTYRGYVSTLQADLRIFGFNPGPIDGFFGPATERAVRLFQEAARTCPHRGRGITYEGGVNGVVDDPTRAELTTWRVQELRRHVEPLDVGRADRLVLAVASVLHGPRPFTRVGHHPERGLVHGLLDFDQRSGALGGLVWRMWSASPRSFRWLFKLGGEETALTRLTSADERTRMSVDLAAGEWTSRFAKAGDVGFWAREQLALARAERLDPALLIAARIGVRHESAIASLHLVAEKGGARLAAAAAARLGRRPPGVAVARHVGRLPALLREMGIQAASVAALLDKLLAESKFDDCPLLAF
ncbi:MAG TPA: peptidoglycan-binding domain-containing protein [Myxococcota bacterium]|jgi:hypothetical protein|nr:peptidoglycan-binding domain-containing protein [Myxococcota bacterium]